MSTRLVDNPNLSGQVIAPDADYPDGSYLDDSTGAAGDGTPIEKSEKDDIEGFLQALRLNSGIIASGNPDTALVSDYLDAFRRLTVLPYVATLNYRVGDMARGSDGLAYQALGVNGPASTVVDPVFDATGVWLMGLAKQRPEGNLLYGGYGQVAQRGTVTGIGTITFEYGIDGVQIRKAASPVRFTMSKGGNIPGQPGSVKLEVTTPDAAIATSDLVVIRMPIEAQDLQVLETGTAGVKKLGIRLVIALPKAGIQSVSIYNEDDSTSFITEINVAAPNTFEEFVFDIPGDPAGVINNDNGAGLWLCIPLFAGSDFQGLPDQWIAGEKYATANQQNQADVASNIIEFVAKVEVGTSTPLERVTDADALNRALRYLEIQGGEVGGQRFTVGQAVSSTEMQAVLSYVQKRVFPTITTAAVGNFLITSAPGGGLALSLINVLFPIFDTAVLQLFTVSASLAPGDASQFYAANTSGIITINSEM